MWGSQTPDGGVGPRVAARLRGADAIRAPGRVDLAVRPGSGHRWHGDWSVPPRVELEHYMQRRCARVLDLRAREL